MNYLSKIQLTILAAIFCFYITPQNTKGQTMYKLMNGVLRLNIA